MKLRVTPVVRVVKQNSHDTPLKHSLDTLSLSDEVPWLWLPSPYINASTQVVSTPCWRNIAIAPTTLIVHWWMVGNTEVIALGRSSSEIGSGSCPW